MQLPMCKSTCSGLGSPRDSVSLPYFPTNCHKIFPMCLDMKASKSGPRDFFDICRIGAYLPLPSEVVFSESYLIGWDIPNWFLNQKSFAKTMELSHGGFEILVFYLT